MLPPSFVSRLLIAALALLTLSLAARAAGDFEHPESRLRFPERLASFERGRIHRYDDVRLGIQVTYLNSGLGKLDFYVFDYGQKHLADGIDSEFVQAAFAKAEEEIRAFGARGHYRNLEKLTAAGLVYPTPAGDPPWRLAGYRFQMGTDDAPPLVSWLLLGAARAHFLKIRYTHDQSRSEAAASELGNFLRAWAEANRD